MISHHVIEFNSTIETLINLLKEIYGTNDVDIKYINNMYDISSTCKTFLIEAYSFYFHSNKFHKLNEQLIIRNLDFFTKKGLLFEFIESNDDKNTQFIVKFIEKIQDTLKKDDSVVSKEKIFELLEKLLLSSLEYNELTLKNAVSEDFFNNYMTSV